MPKRPKSRGRAQNTRTALAPNRSTTPRLLNVLASLARFAIRSSASTFFTRKYPASAPRRSTLAYIDTDKSHRYKYGPMMRWARVALALVVICAIAYVLITPDPNDDVDGVLQPNHPALGHKIPVVSLWESWTPVNVLFHAVIPPGFVRQLLTLELLDFISVCRC
ncbi:MAG TPA: hypothetical protein VK728_15005 [Candidatus Sulfotelmatobacter sp.]|jgi:hypothetical protein|nr:hypothetical protein [Candidatus Sulfotelmatobacter sp.]